LGFSGASRNRIDDLIVANYQTHLRHRGGLKTRDGTIANENLNFPYSISSQFSRAVPEAWKL
jgi:hypothetical protein